MRGSYSWQSSLYHLCIHSIFPNLAVSIIKLYLSVCFFKESFIIYVHTMHASVLCICSACHSHERAASLGAGFTHSCKPVDVGALKQDLEFSRIQQAPRTRLSLHPLHNDYQIFLPSLIHAPHIPHHQGFNTDRSSCRFLKVSLCNSAWPRIPAKWWDYSRFHHIY